MPPWAAKVKDAIEKHPPRTGLSSREEGITARGGEAENYKTRVRTKFAYYTLRQLFYSILSPPNFSWSLAIKYRAITVIYMQKNKSAGEKEMARSSQKNIPIQM